MKTLNPHTIPLTSINLIEASAGTGKSWTVTLLFLRLILEKGLTVDQILVVTFTDAATKELRDAVRKRLVEALSFFEGSGSDSEALPEYKELYGSVFTDDSSLEESLNRLKCAKLSIDEAAIFTIHSFCQRSLTEYAFEASLPFESELMDDDKELMQKLTDDYWRRNFYHAPKTLLYKLQQKSITPDFLLDDIWRHVGKPYLKIAGPKNANIAVEAWAELERLFSKVIEVWREEACDINKLVVGNKNLNGNKYRVSTVEKNCSQLSQINSLSDINKTLLEKDLKRFKASCLKEGTKANAETPCHPFFDLWESFSDLWEEIDASAEGFISQIQIDLLQYLQEELPKEKKRLSILAFDDLLLQLQAALKENESLADDLRHKYKAALIDEFQDTDPIQYDIFSAIYNDTQTTENVVFFVGDPKQAIYSFRGGDIYTYLKAKNNTLEENQYTLNTNYRSHPDLIEAYNSLYESADNPFQDDGIQYEKINAGRDDLSRIEAGVPLQFWRFDRKESEEQNEKADAIKSRIADAVAGDITQLIVNETQIEGRAISGGDFAILVRSHKQGDIIKSALAERGIASIQSSKKTIFETEEANELLSLLTAIVEPQREDGVRRALVTELMGKTADDLLAFETEPDLWEAQLVSFQNWHYQWKKQGFLPMIRSLMRESLMHQRLLVYADGERRLTNVLHLSEIIHKVTRQQSLSMEELLRWLKKQQESAINSMSGKEGELRLESDENLVKIVTIHKSKGLEYPIVYCPFVGLSGKINTDKTYSFHKDKESFLEIGSPDADVHKNLKEKEERAEDTRLLYVALTRAKYRCTVVCFPDGIKRVSDNTALGWLITNGKSLVSGSSKAAKDTNAEFYSSYASNLEALVLASKNISLEDFPHNNSRYESVETKGELTARTFSAEIKSQAQVTSFSGLTAGSHNSEYEAPDHDAQAVPAESVVQATENEFPRGATAGTALHEIFEHLDFEIPVDEQQDIIENSVKKWGFESKHIEAANSLMKQSLQTEIFEGFALQQLSKDKRLDEMEFYLPLERLNVDTLKQILFKHLPDDWQVVRDAVETLSFEEVEGFLKGYIDLIFRHQDKYYIVDYKSNSLPDYASQNLLPVMADSHYYLQYLLYSVALHRYLKKRLADYSWESHMGGAYYLFIRGMNPSLNASCNESNGVFYSKPSFELISAMDDLFMESFL